MPSSTRSRTFNHVKTDGGMDIVPFSSWSARKTKSPEFAVPAGPANALTMYEALNLALCESQKAKLTPVRTMPKLLLGPSRMHQLKSLIQPM